MRVPWKPSSQDWKPATAVRGPLCITITGGKDADVKGLANLCEIMLKETKLTDRVTIETLP